MWGEGGAEVFDQGGVLGGGVIVGDAQDDDGFVREFFGEFFEETVGVFALHAKDEVGPAEVAAGDLDARTVLRAGGPGVVMRVVLKQCLGGGGTPAVAGAEEEEFGFQEPSEGSGSGGPEKRGCRCQT